MMRTDEKKTVEEFDEKNSKSSASKGAAPKNKRTSGTKNYKRGRNGSSRRQSSRNKKETGGSNPLLDSFTSETRVSASNVVVFPTGSASAMVPMNFTSCAGQDNFIDQWNGFTYGVGYSGHTYECKFTNRASRTANLMVLDFIPWFGSTTKANAVMSPLIMSALNLKQFIDTSYGTVTRYNPNDLLLYLMGVAAVFPMIAELKRDLRLVTTYLSDTYPAFVPRGIFAGLMIPDDNGVYAGGEGMDYTAENLRRFVDLLNQNIMIFNRLPMPPELAIFGYNDDLFDAIYADSPDLSTAQLYAFRNKMYWQYEETAGTDEDVDYGAYLHHVVRWDSEPKSIGRRLSQLNEMISKLTALRSSSSAMLTNLFNAYGSRDTITVPVLDYDTMSPLPIVYDEHMLMAIENCVPLHCNWANTTLNPTGALITDIYAPGDRTEVDAAVLAGSVGDLTDLAIDLPLQFHKPASDVTQDDIGWALRFHPSFKSLTYETVHYDAPSVPQSAYFLTPGGEEGFGFIDGFRIVIMSPNENEFGTFQFFTRTLGTSQESQYHWNLTRDFKASPIGISWTYVRDTDGKLTYTVDRYTANRDVEYTTRHADCRMYWSYLAMDLWASTVNRNVVGTRAK